MTCRAHPAPRPGYTWAPGHYEYTRGRYDRHPNRPDAVRYDRDRDGVSNAHDRRPDDPRRH